MSIIKFATKPELFYATIMRKLESPVAPDSVRQGTPILDIMLSNEMKRYWNLDGAQIDGKPLPAGGVADGVHAPRLRIEYDLPYCAGGTSDCTKKVCDVTEVTSENKGWLEFDVDKCVERSFTVKVSDMNNFNERVVDRIADITSRKVYEMKREMSESIITEMYAISNPYPDGTASVGATAKPVTILTDQANILPAGMAKIEGNYRKAQYNGPKKFFGGETMADYFVTREYQGMSFNSVGANSAAPFRNMPFIYDPAFDPVIQAIATDTDSHGITIPDGSLYVYEGYENTGDQVMNLETRISRTIVLDGITWDYDMYLDVCEKQWKIQIKKRYGFASIPASEYCNGTGLIYHWKPTCGAPDCNTVKA